MAATMQLTHPLATLPSFSSGPRLPPALLSSYSPTRGHKLLGVWGEARLQMGSVDKRMGSGTRLAWVCILL